MGCIVEEWVAGVLPIIIKAINLMDLRAYQCGFILDVMIPPIPNELHSSTDNRNKMINALVSGLEPFSIVGIINGGAWVCIRLKPPVEPQQHQSCCMSACVIL